MFLTLNMGSGWIQIGILKYARCHYNASVSITNQWNDIISFLWKCNYNIFYEISLKLTIIVCLSAVCRMLKTSLCHLGKGQVGPLNSKYVTYDLMPHFDPVCHNMRGSIGGFRYYWTKLLTKLFGIRTSFYVRYLNTCSLMNDCRSRNCLNYYQTWKNYQKFIWYQRQDPLRLPCILNLVTDRFEMILLLYDKKRYLWVHMCVEQLYMLFMWYMWVCKRFVCVKQP